ncbi:MAG: hypothetical protein D3926_11910 [Desulfobacteraceae bacterium]|nr:MAG: hypothetical protein D3926_11910 [Desulfobacteraceae bacterium]
MMEKVLHILKSAPDDTIMKIFETMSQESNVSVVELDPDHTDWHALLDNIFEHDSVICWW